PTPVTVQDRRASLSAYVFGVLRASEVARRAVDPALGRRLSVEVSDGPVTLFRSGPRSGTPLLQGQLPVAGRTWAFAAWPAPGELWRAPARWLIALEALALAAL